MMSSRRERGPQPGLRYRPLANNSGVGDAEDGGCLLDRQPAEVAELDDAFLARAEGRHSFERLVHRQHVDLFGAVGRDVLDQRDAYQTAATLVGPARPRQVHEDPSHDAGRRSEEVGPTQPPGLSLIDESDVGLVHEGGRLQRMACRFTTHVCCRQASEFVVEEGYELVERLSPAVARGAKQLRHPRRLGRALIHRVASRIGESGAHRKEEGTSHVNLTIMPVNKGLILGGAPGLRTHVWRLATDGVSSDA